jgi:hypothetical protein
MVRDQSARRESRKSAAAAGRTKFIGSTTCDECGTRTRYTLNGGCIECARSRARRQRKEIKELLEQAGEV